MKAGVVWGLIAGGAALVAATVVIVYEETKSSSGSSPVPPPPPPPPPPAPSTVWTQASTVSSGQRVRIALPTLMVPLSAKTAAGFQQLVSTMLNLSGTNILAWVPGDPSLPSDWPTDDPSPSSEFHAQFNYSGPSVAVSSLPTGIVVWTAPLSTGVHV